MLGGTQYKLSYTNVPPTYLANSVSWYVNERLWNANFGIWLGCFFTILSQTRLKFRYIFEKLGDFGQTLLRPISIWWWMGHFFLDKLVFVWVYFQIPWWHIPTKNKLECPPVCYVCCFNLEVQSLWHRGWNNVWKAYRVHHAVVSTINACTGHC